MVQQFAADVEKIGGLDASRDLLLLFMRSIRFCYIISQELTLFRENSLTRTCYEHICDVMCRMPTKRQTSQGY